MNIVNVKIINTQINSLITDLIKKNITFDSLVCRKQTITLNIKYDDYKYLKKVYKKDIKLIKFYGLEYFKKFIKKNFLFLISIIWGIILVFMLSNLIFFIEINTEDNKVKDIILDNLNEHDIKLYSFKKDYFEIQKIKKEIQIELKDILEWIEIEEYGTKYIINITKRIKNKSDENANTFRDIVASKDGLIKHIDASRGQILTEVNENVKKGQILISGNIYKDDKVVSQVSAEGHVYADVWYKVTSTVPYQYTEYVSKNEEINHYYLDFGNKKMTILGKCNSKYTLKEKIYEINKPYLPFKIIKEKIEVYEYKDYTLSKNEAYKEALKRAREKLNIQLKDDERIVKEIVLSKKYNQKDIIVTMFFIVYENITDYKKINESINLTE